MSAVDDVRRELTSALNLLMRRRAAAGTPAERGEIEAAIDTINEQLQEIGHVSLLEAASLAAAAAASLETVVAGAHAGAFEAFAAQARAQIGRLQALAGSGPARVTSATRAAAAGRPAATRKPVAKAKKKPAAKKAAARKPARRKPVTATKRKPAVRRRTR